MSFAVKLGVMICETHAEDWPACVCEKLSAVVHVFVPPAYLCHRRRRWCDPGERRYHREVTEHSRESSHRNTRGLETFPQVAFPSEGRFVHGPCLRCVWCFSRTQTEDRCVCGSLSSSSSLDHPFPSSLLPVSLIWESLCL